MPKPLNLEGMQFGRLVVKQRAENNGSGGHVRWVCECSCGSGKITTVASSDLKRGTSRSCGCLQKEEAAARVKTHGMTNSSEYNIWFGIKARCLNPKNRAYHHYGGRGITVCDEWKDSFEAFYRDMGPRPSTEHSIDRKDNDGGYSKENCRWATEIEQHNNTRTVKLYDFGGEKLSISQIARKIGISVSALHQRLLIMPWEEAVGYDTITFEGETKSLVDWCGILDLSYREVYRRLRKGDKFENIVSE